MATMALISRTRTVTRDERGFSLVMVGFGFMGLFIATILAIDVGMLMNSRAQAQTSADAGALAGATALVFNNFTNHSATGPAVMGAINTAVANRVAGRSPSVIPADVTFPLNPVTGQFDLVQVTVHRTAARSNPVATLIAQFFGIGAVDVVATATATAAPAGAQTCVLPFTIPDKWIEKGCGMASCTWTTSDTFDMYAKQGQNQNAGAPLNPADVYVPPGSVDATGYSPVSDRGLQLVLKNNTQNKIAPGMYNAWDLPGSEGGDDYRNNIATCNSNLVKIGDTMTPENGNMTGPTLQGTEDLVAADPNAYWNTDCNCVKGSAFSRSPRIRVVPLYNPVRYTEGQNTGKSQPELEVVNYLGFFVEEVNGGGEVIGRITPITGRVTPGTGPPIGAFSQAIMLVK
jgi:Putative Flp pilus-assembly TadE/G-like